MGCDPGNMYRWRRMTPEQRDEVLKDRLIRGKPPHSVPHVTSDCSTYYLITTACLNHAHIIGHSPDRMRQFESDLVACCQTGCRQVFAWTLLPNHYHVLVDTCDILLTLKMLGRLHGRNSFYWNGEEDRRGRQVWCNAAETVMKSEGHYYASLNYVLHNPVYHGYVQKWVDWPFCNAGDYLETVGRERALSICKAYPLYDYGKDWDPPDL